MLHESRIDLRWRCPDVLTLSSGTNRRKSRVRAHSASNYRVTSSNEHIRLLRVFDDGANAYLQMPSAMEHRESPSVLVIGAGGKGTMTYYRVQ